MAGKNRTQIMLKGAHINVATVAILEAMGRLRADHGLSARECMAAMEFAFGAVLAEAAPGFAADDFDRPARLVLAGIAAGFESFRSEQRRGMN